MQKLEFITKALVADGKGILAADESLGTIKKRFDSIGLECTEETRRAYREMLFSTQGIEDYISGVILFDETIRQTRDDGFPLRETLDRRGIIVGIKVDSGARDLARFPGEKITEGFDGLRERLSEYRELGARFTKWRSVITIGEGIPTQFCIDANAHALARFAALSQEAGLAPIVEPEVLMDGDHGIDRCEEATEAALRSVFDQLARQRLVLEGMLLKPNMVIPGKKCPDQADVSEVAERTIRTLRRTVPAAVPGIVFLSGGQTPEQATAHLNAMNVLNETPWQLSFSFARALQEPPLHIWRGQASNVPAAQAAFLHRARMNGLARLGRYSAAAERSPAGTGAREGSTRPAI